MSFPKVVSRAEWLTARTELLRREKDLARARDRLNADRRRLPMVRIDKDYRFTGPDGETVSFSDWNSVTLPPPPPAKDVVNIIKL